MTAANPRRDDALSDEARRMRAEVFDAFCARHPQIARFEAYVFDLHGRARGKRYAREAARRVFMDGCAVSNSTFLLDASGSVTNAGGSGFDDGDPDVQAIALPHTLAIMPWADPPAAQFQLAARGGQEGRPDLDPRIHAGRLVEALAREGLAATVAFELEFYLLAPRLSPAGAPLPPRAPVGGRRDPDHQVYDMEQLAEFAPVIEDILAAAERQGLPVTVASTEYGRGQFEANLHHRTDALRAADEALALRRLVKGVARRHGLAASFMPKPFLDDAGSGMHVNVSLADATGRPLFAPGADGALPAPLARAIAGLVETLPAFLALFAPHRNAWRRYRPNLFVPVAANWGIDNRSAALRVILDEPARCRIEHRVAGADASAHLVLLAVLAGMLHGIRRRLDPPPPVAGNAGGAMDPAFAAGPAAAISRLRDAAPALAPDIDATYLPRVADALAHELARLESEEIPPLEYRWYL
ncbi:MAG: glutamine synthetase [Rhodothalassiaceae bacterium]|nr:MAG: glutamine synthetase [Rhodothalassiaceae bacterium]